MKIKEELIRIWKYGLDWAFWFIVFGMVAGFLFCLLLFWNEITRL